MHPRIRTSLAALVLAALVLASGSVAGDARTSAHYKVIVHPRNPSTSIDQDFLRGAFLRKVSAWGHGQGIHPVDLSKRFSVREQFIHEVLKKTPAQLKSYWSQQIFSGKRTPPPEVGAPADVISYVLANPGSVGYLPEDVDPGGAKVVEVK